MRTSRRPGIGGRRGWCRSDARGRGRRGRRYGIRNDGVRGTSPKGVEGQERQRRWLLLTLLTVLTLNDPPGVLLTTSRLNPHRRQTTCRHSDILSPRRRTHFTPALHDLEHRRERRRDDDSDYHRPEVVLHDRDVPQQIARVELRSDSQDAAGN